MSGCETVVTMVTKNHNNSNINALNVNNQMSVVTELYNHSNIDPIRVTSFLKSLLLKNYASLLASLCQLGIKRKQYPYVLRYKNN